MAILWLKNWLRSELDASVRRVLAEQQRDTETLARIRAEAFKPAEASAKKRRAKDSNGATNVRD